MMIDSGVSAEVLAERLGATNSTCTRRVQRDTLAHRVWRQWRGQATEADSHRRNSGADETVKLAKWWAC
jgi:IS30 family transposase